MTQRPGFPRIEIGTLTEVFSGCTSATNHAGTDCGPLSSSAASVAAAAALRPVVRSVMLT